MSTPDGSRPLSPDDALPPVEPPTAGFIIRLFVVPALIVTSLFGGWLLLQSLVQRGADPMAYVQALRRDNEARWQAAVSLADALRDVRDPRNAELRQNTAIARELADILNQQMTEGRTDDKAVKLRVYLCNALGEFQSPDVLPALLKAAKQEKTEAEHAVRFSALKALAVQVDSNKAFDKSQHRDVLDALIEASRDDDPLLRSTAAFGLGAWGGDDALKRVEQMLADSVPDVRYNAATMLARQGRTSAVPVLAEMLDPAALKGLDTEKAESREAKRLTIIISAMAAVGKLGEANPTADLRPLEEALAKLLATKLPEKVRLEATAVQRQLERRHVEK